MISDELKFIFVHIPKTGGSSVSYFLRNVANEDVKIATSRLGPGKGVSVNESGTNKNVKHKSFNKFKEPKWDNYYRFSIVRNPYDRTMSYYFWYKGNKMKRGFDKKDFIKFVKQIRDPQSSYVLDPETGDMLADKIVRYEHLVKDLGTIPCLKKFNFSNLPRLNVSRNDYRKFYDKELKDIVYRKFKKDFELFGYKK